MQWLYKVCNDFVSQIKFSCYFCGLDGTSINSVFPRKKKNKKKLPSYSPKCGMGKRTLCVDWVAVNGARKKKRKLSLECDEDGIYDCPVSSCMHSGFRSIRGCRMHVTNKQHAWWYYFDVCPEITRSELEKSELTVHHSPHPCKTTSVHISHIYLYPWINLSSVWSM